MVGSDAGPAQVEQLKDGVVQAPIAQLPGDIGAKGVEQAVAAVKGQQVTPSIPADATIVTAENVYRPEVQKVLYKAGCRSGPTRTWRWPGEAMARPGRTVRRAALPAGRQGGRRRTPRPRWSPGGSPTT
jgi:hypothetical protein